MGLWQVEPPRRGPEIEIAPIPEAVAAGPLAVDGPELTLAELESIALEANPTLVQAKMRVQAASGKHLQVGLYPNPVLGYRGEDMGAAGTAGKQGGFVAQEIVTTGKLRLRRAAASHEIVQAQCALEAQRKRVLNDVRVGWRNALITQEILKLNEELVEIGQKGVNAAQQLLNAKEVSPVDVLQAKIEADSARLKLFDAKNQHIAAWRQLVAVAGVPNMQPSRLAGDPKQQVPELDWDNSLGRLLSESPELGEARAGVQRAKCELAEQYAERIPNLDFQAAVSRDNPDRRTIAEAELAWPVPVFNRNQGNIRSASARLVSARKEVARLELALADRLAIAYARYASARNEVQKYAANILPNAKTSLDLVELGYRQGEFDYLKLLTAQRTYFQVNLAYLRSLLEAQAEAIRIEGLLLSGGLGEETGDEGLRIFELR